MSNVMLSTKNIFCQIWLISFNIDITIQVQKYSVFDTHTHTVCKCVNTVNSIMWEKPKLWCFSWNFITNISHFWPLVSEFIRFWEKIVYICFFLFGVILFVSWTGIRIAEAGRVLLSNLCSTSKPPRPDNHGLKP